MAKKVKRTDLISEIIKDTPKVAEMLTDYGLHCANCFLNTFDTVESGAQLHGMTNEEIDRMVEEINSELERDAK